MFQWNNITRQFLYSESIAIIVIQLVIILATFVKHRKPSNTGVLYTVPSISEGLLAFTLPGRGSVCLGGKLYHPLCQPWLLIITRYRYCGVNCLRFF